MLGVTLQQQGKLKEAEMFDQRAVDMLRLSPNKHATKFAHGEKSGNIGLSLKDRYVVHLLSTGV